MVDGIDSWSRSSAGRPRASSSTLSRDGQCPLPNAVGAAGRPGPPAPAVPAAGATARRPPGRAVRSTWKVALRSTSLPEPFVVRGDLTISAAPNLSSLPAGLRVEGSLRLDRCPGRAVAGRPPGRRRPHPRVLPRSRRRCRRACEVGGSLIIRRCPIVRLPSCLRVGRDLRLHRLRDLDGLPEGLAVPGRLELIRCPSLREIAPGLAGRGRPDHPPLRRSPGPARGPSRPGTLDLRGCTGLEALPAGLERRLDSGGDAFRPALRLADCRP